MTNSSSMRVTRPHKLCQGYLYGQIAGADGVADVVSGRDGDWRIYCLVFWVHISSVIPHIPLLSGPLLF